MSKIKVNVELSSTCLLKVTDISGYIAPDGFLLESNTSPLVSNSYKLSHGYFINVLLYNRYNNTATLVNGSEGYYQPSDISDVYADNFVPNTYSITKDGSYTLTRLFIISETFYDANKNTSLFDDKVIFYADGINTYKVDNGVATEITITQLLSEDLTNMVGLKTSTSFLSLCNINNCYIKLMNEVIALNPLDCNSSSSKNLLSNRDLIYMTLQVINYLVGQGSPSQVQKLLENVNICDGICGSTSSFNFDCGCNG